LYGGLLKEGDPGSLRPTLRKRAKDGAPEHWWPAKVRDGNPDFTV
jgi:hypothetical protein